MPRARKLSQPSNAAPRRHIVLRAQDERLLVLARARLGMSATDVIREVFDHARRSRLPLMVELLELAAKEDPCQ